MILLKRSHSAFVLLVLSFFWGWMAIVYHLIFFTRINPLATYFSVLFLIQSGLLLWHGVIRRAITLNQATKRGSFLGYILLAYGLIIYPALNIAFNHHYSDNPTFGVPCPTTIFTIGILWFADVPFPRHIFFIPLCWSVIGTSAAIFLYVPEDYGLALAGLLALVKLLQPQMNRLALKL